MQLCLAKTFFVQEFSDTLVVRFKVSYTDLFYTDPRDCNFLEEVRGCYGAFRIFLGTGLKLRIGIGALILFCRLPNRIVDEHTTACDPSVKLCRNESWLSLHNSSVGSPNLEKLIDLVRFHVKFIHHNNRSNVRLHLR
jgi:hypothetical protein